jgi:NADPH:quinone reductase-like Zn-dependent oxidoreductase
VHCAPAAATTRSVAPSGTLLKIVFLNPFILGKRVRVLMALPNPRRITAIQELVEAGTLKLVIDRSYPLREAAQALRYLGEGHSKGKVVIEVVSAEESAIAV